MGIMTPGCSGLTGDVRISTRRFQDLEPGMRFRAGGPDVWVKLVEVRVAGRPYNARVFGNHVTRNRYCFFLDSDIVEPVMMAD
jgi:hypothetical protein